MNEFDDIDRMLDEAFAERPSVLSRPSLRDVKQRARRHQRQRSAGLLGACAVVGVGGAAVLATRGPANTTTVGQGDGAGDSIFCTPTTNVVYDTSTMPLNTGPDSMPTEVVTPDTTPEGVLTYYIVKTGDNPTLIADAFGVTLEALNAANVDTYDYELFYEGLAIAIPTGGTLGTYALQEGDFPGSVAEMFHVTVAELDAANRDVPGYGEFIVGTVINIPPPSQGTATTSTNVAATTFPPTTVIVDSTAWPTSTMSGDPTDDLIQTVRLIGADDSREALAAEYGITVEEFDAANAGNPGYADWIVGTLIQIPFPNLLVTPVDSENSNCLPTPASTMPENTATTIEVVNADPFVPTKRGTMVQVANCSNQEGVARYLSDQLVAEGFLTAEPDTCTIDLPVTKIIYNPDDPIALEVAKTVRIFLANAVVEPSGPVVPTLTTGTWAAGSGVIVLLGDDLAGKTLAEILGNSATATTIYTQDDTATSTTCIEQPQMTLPPPATTTTYPGAC